MAVEHTYRYSGTSTYRADAGLSFATAGGRSTNPHFFRGFAGNAQQAARAILAVAEVARSRYFDPGAAQLARDPIVTSNRSVVRFESFSACNGVYARFDLDADGFDADFVDWGTTNVDVNDPLRAALVSVAAGEPLRLTIGTEALAVDTLDGTIVERKVPLPERWLRGLAEVQLASAAMAPVAALDTAQARAVIRDVPRQSTGNRRVWLDVGRAGARLSQRARGGLPALVGPQRLGALARLAPHVRRLTVHAATRSHRPDGTEVLRPSGWVVELDHARLTLVLSPELYRGFSGEGTVLHALATARETEVGRVTASLAGQAGLTPASFAADGVGPDDAIDALRVLGAAGRVGHELASGTYFHRDLPFDRSALEDMHPRLVDARRLTSSVELDRDHGRAVVSSDGTHYTVTLSERGETCTCPWFAKHQGERGPCKHALAVQLVNEGPVGS